MKHSDDKDKKAEAKQDKEDKAAQEEADAKETPPEPVDDKPRGAGTGPGGSAP